MTDNSFSLTRCLFKYRQLITGLIASKDLEDFSLKIIPILSKLGFALPIACLLHSSIRRLAGTTARYHILIIEKAIFNEDALEVLGAAPEIQVFGLRRVFLKVMALGVLPRHVCDDATYVSEDPAAADAKIRYLKLCRGVWRYLSVIRRYDLVLTGNWCYWAEREFATALEECATPFVVLHKEGIKPPARSLMLRELFKKTRGQFTGRRVLVYHESERDHQIDGCIAKPEQITIVGMPRLDRLHAWRKRAAMGYVKARSEKPLALFLAFIPNNFLPSYSGIDCDMAWTQLCTGTYRAAIILAQSHPEIDVIIRPRGYEHIEVEYLLKQQGVLPSNLRIVVEGDITPLIEASWLICGHNTTVLLEGLAAGKPVIVPHFGEALDDRYKGYIVDLGEAVEHADSVSDLVTRLEAHCSSERAVQEPLSPAVLVELAKWTGNPDGAASSRALDALRLELSRPLAPA
jgi:hypothetical protein